MRKIGFILFILLIIYFIFLIRQDIMDLRDLKSDQVRLKKNIVKEKQLTKQLKTRFKLGNLEEFARTRLGMVKKGETAYKIVQ